MEYRIAFDALMIGLQIGFLLCLGIVMILAGRKQEKYTRRIHLLTGLFCCLLALEFLIPSIFMNETLDVYYRGAGNAHTAKVSSVIIQGETFLSYPMLAMVLFSLFQAFRPIPFRTILLPLALPAAPDSSGQRLSAEMLGRISVLLETECIQSRAFLDQQLTRDKLAAALGTNSTYLSRYFAQKGTNFNEYINSLRLDYACRMIMDSNEENIALNRIATSSGFAHYRTFSRLFVNRFGVSPADWRKNNSQKTI